LYLIQYKCNGLGRDFKQAQKNLRNPTIDLLRIQKLIRMKISPQKNDQMTWKPLKKKDEKEIKKYMA